MMFGYSCDETAELIPTPIVLAQRLVENMAELRKSEQLDYILPETKRQLTIEYVEGIPTRSDSIVISTQHKQNVSHDTI